MASQNQRIIEASLPKFQKGFQDEVFENSPTMRMLQAKGRIKTGGKGTELQWRIRNKQHALEVISDGASNTASRKNLWTTAKLAWVGYAMDNASTLMERLQNGSGETRVFEVVGGILDALSADMKDELNKEIFKNSDATGNTGRLSGFETFLKDNTADSNKAIGRRQFFIDQTVDDSDYLDSNSYAGLTLDSDDVAPYSWSPVLVNSQATTGTPTFTDFTTSPLEILDFAITQLRDNSKGGEIADMCVMTTGWESIVRNALITKETIFVKHGDPLARETAAGIKTIHFSGVPIFADVDAAAGVATGSNVAYLFNSKHLTYNVLGPQFVHLHKQNDIDTLSEKYKLAHFGQLNIDSPRHMCKIFDYNIT